MKRTLVLPAAVYAAVVALAGCGSDEPGSGPVSDQSRPATPSSTTVAQHNQADVMFVRMMIPHHAQAIAMSNVVLEKADVDERVVTLAEDIRTAQQSEIETMKSWLQEWGEPLPDPSDSMGGHDMGGGPGGMMSEDGMASLKDAEGAGASKLFLEQMIPHHQGAVMMAEKQIADGVAPDAVALAKSIETSQRAEIDLMQELLASF